MARYTGPKCKLCRREGMKLFLKGDRCNNAEKCAFDHRPYPPGQHGQGRGKKSDYGVQLREKQKVKRTYGLLEKQFRLYFAKAERMKGITGENLLQLLERRLDNVIFRMGLAGSRSEARQVVRHCHIAVDGRCVSIPSFIVKAGQEISVRESSKTHKRVEALAESPVRETPAWLELDRKELKGKVVALPTRDEVDLIVQESLIVELYSK